MSTPRYEIKMLLQKTLETLRNFKVICSVCSYLKGVLKNSTFS